MIKSSPQTEHLHGMRIISINIEFLLQYLWHLSCNSHAAEFFSMSKTYTHRPLYWIHLSNCSLRQISNQPITWQQLNAFRHVDMVKMICCSSNQASEWERKVI
ncbi:hypothetical protein XENOCAPTIV_019408 [Xenoophorus captivus]|uniref:Uncharacterized protein n=1 Tax=Xenoophorus captivus TaxID=1517983 RepID=A0ABV0RZH3_9TELE